MIGLVVVYIVCHWQHDAQPHETSTSFGTQQDRPQSLCGECTLKPFVYHDGFHALSSLTYHHHEASFDKQYSICITIYIPKKHSLSLIKMIVIHGTNGFTIPSCISQIDLSSFPLLYISQLVKVIPLYNLLHIIPKVMD